MKLIFESMVRGGDSPPNANLAFEGESKAPCSTQHNHAAPLGLYTHTENRHSAVVVIISQHVCREVLLYNI